MTCDRYIELLSARLDGVLTDGEERELEEHLAICPDCRAAAAQLAALQGAFSELEDIPAPEGFAQGVMDRVRAEAPPKVIPLFKRPRFRALAGLAACAALVVGLYSVSRLQQDSFEDDIVVRSFNKDAVMEDALPGDAEAPQIASYSDSEETAGGTVYGADTQKAAPERADCDGMAPLLATPMVDRAVLILDRMPEGGWDLIPPETPVSPEGVFVTEELFEEIEQLVQEQNITAERNSNVEDAEEFVIIILQETE